MARILIVEDEEDLGALYRMALEAEGHQVVGVYADPSCPIAEGAKLRASPPDLVILDERVRSQSGTAFIPQYRTAFPSAQILVATADVDAAGSALKRGADNVQRKPFTLQRLVEHVRSMVGDTLPPAGAPDAADGLTVKDYLRLAQDRCDTGEIDGAIAACEEALRLDPSSARAWCNRGALRMMKGDFEGAVADCQEAIRLAPDLSLAWYNRGLARERRHELDEAIADYSRAIELDPNHAEAYNNRGIVRSMKNELDDAIRDFDEAVRLEPQDPDAYCNRGLTLFRKGVYADALLDLRKALAVAPARWPHRAEVKRAVKEIRKAL